MSAVLSLFLLGWLAFFSNEASALDLSVPLYLETTQVLPAGVRNPRLLNLWLSLDSKFDGGGKQELLGSSLNRPLSWKDLIQARPNELEKSIIRSLLRESQLSEGGGPGATTGVIRSFVDAKVPALAFGVTDRFTLGVAIPVMKISVQADTGFVRSEEGQKWVNRLCALSEEQCSTVANQLNHSIDKKLEEEGYEPIRSQEQTHIGDIQLLGKFLLTRNNRSSWGVRSSLVIPTGVPAQVNRLVDVPTGEGTFQVGSALLYDRELARKIRWNTFGGLQTRVPHSIERRIPRSLEDPLSKDKEFLTRSWGHVMTLGTSVQRTFSRMGLVAGAGYQFQFMTRTQFKGGSKYSSERYDYLESLYPSQFLHSLTVMTGFSTVEWFQNKKFFYPFQANLAYSYPFLGRNAPLGKAWVGELILFF